MECPACDATMVTFEVPVEYREYAPSDASAAGICPACLAVERAEDAASDPAFERVSEAFPDDPGAAVPMALAVGLLDSLALHRRDVESLLAAVEVAGVDPLLVLDRLDSEATVRPGFDLGRRRRQVQQLLE